MPKKSIHTSIRIPAPTQRVWDTLVDFSKHREWNPLFASIEGEPAQGERLRVAARKEGNREGFVFRPTIVEARRGRVLRWKGALLFRGVFDGLHSFELHALSEKETELVHCEEFSGILIPFMGGLIAQTKLGFEAFNQALLDRVLESTSAA